MGRTITIVKADGQRAPLDVKKLERSVRRIGASRSLAREVVEHVVPEIHDGMTTAQIHARMLRALQQQRDHRMAARYSLKDAMRRLGPAGYDFEQFVAVVLRAYGYVAVLPQLLRGMDVEQEVDVVAQKGSVTAMIEAKYRNEPGLYVHLKDVMATWARFLDLRESHAKGKQPYAFTEPWIVCNTKVTADGVAFGEGKGMRIIGWEYPKGEGLEQKVIEKHLYPVTVLRSVTTAMRPAFASAGLLLCHDVAALTVGQLTRRTRLPTDQLERVLREIQTVMGEC